MAASPTREREGMSQLDCPRCGSPFAQGQEYCLECGDRLPPSLSAADTRGRPPTARRLVAAWPLLVALVVATLAAAVVLIAEGTETAANGTIVAPLPRPDGPPPEEELAEIEPPPEAAPTRPAPRPQRPRRRSDAAGGAIVQWPAGRPRGFTVVLASIPDVRGRGSATESAQAAARAGLSRVGILNPDVFSSLHPGYYVVFNGIHNTRAAAERAVDAARSAGFDDAYVAEVAR